MLCDYSMLLKFVSFSTLCSEKKLFNFNYIRPMEVIKLKYEALTYPHKTELPLPGSGGVSC